MIARTGCDLTAWHQSCSKIKGKILRRSIKDDRKLRTCSWFCFCGCALVLDIVLFLVLFFCGSCSCSSFCSPSCPPCSHCSPCSIRSCSLSSSFSSSSSPSPSSCCSSCCCSCLRLFLHVFARSVSHKPGLSITPGGTLWTIFQKPNAKENCRSFSRIATCSNSH